MYTPMVFICTRMASIYVCKQHVEWETVLHSWEFLNSYVDMIIELLHGE